MGETCPQYLFFTIENLRGDDGAKWICSPPMRTEQDNEALWLGLSDGGFQTIGTDHCPFFFDGTKSIEYEGKSVKIPGKELGANDFTKIPNGLPGVGDRMPILWSYGVGQGRITPNQFVALTSTNAAKIFGLYPQKGVIMAGSDADLVIFDPEVEYSLSYRNLHINVDWSPFEGVKVKGCPVMTICRGKILSNGDKFLGERGWGRPVKRHINPDILEEAAVW